MDHSCYMVYCVQLYILWHKYASLLAPEKIQELQKKLFDKSRQFLTTYLNPDDMIDHLITHHLVGDIARQQISSPYQIPSFRNGIILDELSRGQPGTVQKFCMILKKSGMTQHIADKLEKGFVCDC